MEYHRQYIDESKNFHVGYQRTSTTKVDGKTEEWKREIVDFHLGIPIWKTVSFIVTEPPITCLLPK